MPLEIPPYIAKPVLCDAEMHGKWMQLDNAITQIYIQNPGNLSFQVLYTVCYTFIKERKGDYFYPKVEQALTKHAAALKCKVIETHDASFLSTLIETWEQQKRAVARIGDLLMYMDKNYSRQEQKRTVVEMGVYIFGEQVLRQPDVAGRMKKLVTTAVALERKGEKPPDRLLLKDLTKMACEVSRRSVYEPFLEAFYLESSKNYYSAEAQSLIDDSTTPTYLKKVFKRLEEETDRIERCLADSTLPKIEKVVKDRMIANYSNQLLQKEGSGVLSMLKDWRLHDLGLLYKALSLVGQSRPLLERISLFLIEHGSLVVQETQEGINPIAVIDEILVQRERYDELLDVACSNTDKAGIRSRDKDFERQIMHAFITIVNKNQRFPEYLSTALDAKLRKTGVTDDEYDSYFDKIIIVFQYLRDKDVFEKYYRNQLARRLLLSKSCTEGERAFISKLKTESGYQFTAKIEGMFKDMNISQSNIVCLKEYLNDKGIEPPVDLMVHVLTTGFWPFSSKSFSPVELPPAVEAMKNHYHSYYMNSHSGRRLTWLPHMGTADLRMNVNGKKYEVNVHTIQMAILMCFNEQDEVTIKDLVRLTKVTFSELKRHLLSLAMQTKIHGKILRMEGSSKDMNENTVISANPSFQSKRVKFKLNSLVLKETEDQAQETRSKVDDDRKWQLDAMIVRIMKSRKSIEHRNLIAEVIDLVQSRFQPSPDVIKKRIESLIERDYIERSNESRSKYVYLA
eukprot:TRINITY_DN449_c4_g1_i1.p1 TRINITY_DN449_c4_g1~~TRINITY_DN449_c4_g1_i1.p1  ORF type:complete len:738 (+),score=115.51 TRINITY_DN449_c4_g1_i1:95-2308(+)